MVIALLGILATLLVPAFNAISSGFTLGRSGDQVTDEIQMARQLAASRSRNVEVRFIRLAGNANAWAMQTWMMDETGTNRKPVRKIMALPDSITINEAYSPIVGSSAPLSGTGDFASRGTRPYVGFRFRPDGSTDIPLSQTNAGIVLQSANKAAGSVPENYYAILINPLTGKISTFRP